jgi:hypothetical protein
VKSVVAVNLTSLLVQWRTLVAPVGLSGYCVQLKDQQSDFDEPLATITVPSSQEQCVISGVDLRNSSLELRVGYAVGTPPTLGSWSLPSDRTVAPCAPAVPVVKLLLPSDRNSLRIEWSSLSDATPAVSAYELSIGISDALEREPLTVAWLGIPDKLPLLSRAERTTFYEGNLVLVEQPRTGLGGGDGFNGDGNVYSRFGKRVPIYSGNSLRTRVSTHAHTVAPTLASAYAYTPACTSACVSARARERVCVVCACVCAVCACVCGGCVCVWCVRVCVVRARARARACVGGWVGGRVCACVSGWHAWTDAYAFVGVGCMCALV